MSDILFSRVSAWYSHPTLLQPLLPAVPQNSGSLDVTDWEAWHLRALELFLMLWCPNQWLHLWVKSIKKPFASCSTFSFLPPPQPPWIPNFCFELWRMEVPSLEDGGPILSSFNPWDPPRSFSSKHSHCFLEICFPHQTVSFLITQVTSSHLSSGAQHRTCPPSVFSVHTSWLLSATPPVGLPSDLSPEFQDHTYSYSPDNSTVGISGFSKATCPETDIASIQNPHCLWKFHLNGGYCSLPDAPNRNPRHLSLPHSHVQPVTCLFSSTSCDCRLHLLLSIPTAVAVVQSTG